MAPSASASPSHAPGNAAREPHASSRAREVMDRLLAFEGEGSVLDHTLPTDAFMMWPLVRMRVFDDAIFHALGTLGPPPGPPRSLRSVLRREARYAAHILRHDPLRHPGPLDLLMFGSTVGVTSQRDGRWFGRINDHFALEYEPRTLVLDESQGRTFRWPRYPAHVAAHDALPMRAALRARLRRPRGGPSDADAAAIERFVGSLRERLPIAALPRTLARVTAELRGFAAQAECMREVYLRLFERTRARMLFLEDGSFSTRCYILKWAREAGLRTAEFQHGVIIPSMPSYNHAQSLCVHAAYARYFPEFLLTYGPFWNENTQTPSRLVTIGNPHFELERDELLARKQPPTAGPGRRLLFVSQTDAAPDLVPVAAALSARLPPGDILIYRLHPAEPVGGPTYAPLHGLPNVQIQRTGDIYELLHAADAVIGVSSTALFEAAGLGRPVHIFANPSAEFFMPRSFGQWFEDAAALHAQLERARSTATDPNHYFAADYRPRFRAFIHETLGANRAI